MSKKDTYVFISYHANSSKDFTFPLKEHLEAQFHVWQDNLLLGGTSWDEIIYERIRESDVLVLVVGSKTSESVWVRREVEIARANLVAILPVRHVPEVEALRELKAMEFQPIQIEPYLSRDEKELGKIYESIRNLKNETRAKQNKWFATLKSKRVSQKADDKQRAFTFHTSRESCNIHIATGDLANTENIDVIVNSENDFMQMSRHFESRTVSAILRIHGALKDDDQRFIEDTVQDELNLYLSSRSRPVGPTSVIVTSAGHPQSDLSQINGAKFIFHVASVLAQEDGLKSLTQDYNIRTCVRNCLKKIGEVNTQKGVISPEGTAQRDEQMKYEDSYEGIKSIIFPLIGTGQGGRPVSETIGPMAEAIRSFVDSSEFPPTLESIYISVFAESDVEVVKAELSNNFEYVKSH